jgi:hypothetical protein
LLEVQAVELAVLVEQQNQEAQGLLVKVVPEEVTIQVEIITVLVVVAVLVRLVLMARLLAVVTEVLAQHHQ